MVAKIGPSLKSFEVFGGQLAASRVPKWPPQNQNFSGFLYRHVIMYDESQPSLPLDVLPQTPQPGFTLQTVCAP